MEIKVRIAEENDVERVAMLYERYDILVGEEFSCLEFHMDRDTISWILNNWIQEVAYGEIAEIHT